MNIYSIVHDGVIAQYEAMALVQDAVPGSGPAAGMMIRAQGRQVAPIYASLAQSATDRAAQTGPVAPSTAGPVPLPTFAFPAPGWADASGLPRVPGLPGSAMPGLPGLPNLPRMPGWPTLPNPAIPSFFGMLAGIPGLDLCAFLKCLVGAMPCSCKPETASTIGGRDPDSDPVRQLIDQAVGMLERARQITDAAAKEAEQRVADLKAAAVNASEARRKAMTASQKAAEEGLREAKRRGDEISTAVGNVIAGFPR